MTIAQQAFEIILTGSLVAVACSLLGTFLVLRKMAMVGDAISHAVLPGIVIAYLVSGSRDSTFMLFGAAALGLITTFLIELFHKKARLQEDASIGITFTWLFAIGVIMISVMGGAVDLDQDCVLYGDILMVPIDHFRTASGLDLGPEAVWVMSGVLILIVIFLAVGFKELFLTTFDPSYAAAIGVSIGLWHYLLMGLVSVTTVAAFESVGAILVVAFLVGPPATAWLLTNDLKKMLVISSILGILAAAGGYFLASAIDGSLAGGMATVVGFEFALAFLFSPSQGLLVGRSKKVKLRAERLGEKG